MDLIENDQPQSQLLPPILVPHKLLSPNNFKYHMSGVENILEYAKEHSGNSPLKTQLNSNTMYNQNHQHSGQQSDRDSHLDVPHNNNTPQIKRLSQTPMNVKSTQNQAILAKKNVTQSYKSLLFTARNFGITNSHYFNTDQSRLHAQQRYGRNKSQKLNPLRRTKSDKFFQENLAFKPKRAYFTEIDERYFFKKVLSVQDMGIVVSFNSFKIELKGPSEDKKKAKDKVIKNLHFSDTLYLCEHSFEYINTFFSRFVEYSQPRNEIMIDWEGFSKIPYIKPNDTGDQVYPSHLYNDVPQSDQTLEISFPSLEFYLNDIGHLQTYTCTQQEIQQLLKDQFNSLQHQTNRHFHVQDALNAKKEIQNKYDLQREAERQEMEKQFNPEDKSLINGATKIQASFKGRQARQEFKNKQNEKQQKQEEAKINEQLVQQQIQEEVEEDFHKQFNPQDKELVGTVTKMQAAFKGKKTRQNNQKEQEEKKIQKKKEEDEKQQLKEQFNPEDKDLVNSVTKIQASFKGKKAREDVKDKKEKVKKDKFNEEMKQQFNPEDQSLIGSATKIQANFKGKKARQEVTEKKKQKQQEDFKQQFNPEDQDLVNSVTKIQASFKGNKTRKDVLGKKQDKNNTNSQNQIKEEEEPKQENLKEEQQQKEEEEDFSKQYDPEDKEMVDKITKIQATIKGQQVRKAKKNKQSDKQETQQQLDQQQQGQEGKQKEQIEEEEEEEDFAKQYNPQDQEMVDKITKIQATIKGNQVRKANKGKKPDEKQPQDSQQADQQKTDQSENKLEI